MKTKKGNHFSINTVKTILENATYTGQIEWGKHREWERKRRKGRQEEYCIVKGEHQPIITMELWNQVQNINAEQNRNNITYSNFKGDFILAGILKCPSCGAGTVMTKAKKRNKEGYHLYYMCQNYHSKGITACSSNLIKKELIEEKVLAGIQGLLTNPQIVENICIALNTEKNEGIEDLQVHLSIAKTELRKVEKLKRDTEGYYLNGDLDVRVYNTTMISALENEERIRSQIEQIQKSISTHTSVFQISREFIIEALKDFNNLSETADNEMKRALLRSLIKSIEVESNRKDIKSIVFWFTEDDTFTKFVLPENELR
ncbi:hypothetical protein EB820_00540 [Brevibacillus agri]|uniref:Recombinase domain-containing protein n=3 Tax=Brevibacillus agri TaxID=51101 RepID=A0A3M8BF31_9BACL|nr:recombinase family protein [Brevibacillus agri]QAV11879.1 hypothetical protein BA6348_03385 [Brevibacillus agri]RNB62040.1 hypothetical protein EB820_00540 [Brevibacillus agri]